MCLKSLYKNIHKSLSCSAIEGDSSPIEFLYWSEVVHNICILLVLQGPEHGELLGGDLDRSDEVDPVDNLHAAGGGEGAFIVAVFSGGVSGKGSHSFDKVSDLGTSND